MNRSPRLTGVLAGGEWLVRRGDVEQMMRNQRTLLARRFGRPNLEMAIERNGIATDNFARERLREVDGECGFAGGGRPENYHQERFRQRRRLRVHGFAEVVNGRPRESSCRSAETPAPG